MNPLRLRTVGRRQLARKLHHDFALTRFGKTTFRNSNSKSTNLDQKIRVACQRQAGNWKKEGRRGKAKGKPPTGVKWEKEKKRKTASGSGSADQRVSNQGSRPSSQFEQPLVIPNKTAPIGGTSNTFVLRKSAGPVLEGDIPRKTSASVF